MSTLCKFLIFVLFIIVLLLAQAYDHFTGKNQKSSASQNIDTLID